MALNVRGQALPNGLLSSGLRGSGASADEENEPENALLADSRLGIFINGRLNFGEQDQTQNQDGFDFDTLGVTLGVDYRFRSNLVIGAAVGYSDSEVEFNFDGGDMQSESITLKKNGDIILKGKNITQKASGKIAIKGAGNVIVKGKKIAGN